MADTADLAERFGGFASSEAASFKSFKVLLVPVVAQPMLSKSRAVAAARISDMGRKLFCCSIMIGMIVWILGNWSIGLYTRIAKPLWVCS